MGAQRSGTAIAIVLGLLLLALAIVYWVVPASALPVFLPGHKANSPALHVKHGLIAFTGAFFCFVLAWFQIGPKRTM